jgi:hypothetical protein
MKKMLLTTVALLLAGAAAWWLLARAPTLPPPNPAASPAAATRPIAERSGSVFLPPPASAFAAPAVRELQLPAVAGGASVWGATGRDHRGRIHVGVSVHDMSASPHLLELDPASGTWRDRGNPRDELRRLGLLRDGESQVKLHSRIVQAADGYLYFASFDEDGEDQRTHTQPRWGGHLWRMHPERDGWEHLLATSDALIAVGTTGRHVYALGYFDHALHVFDTLTGETRRTVVGAAGGHVSRNLVVGADEHAFVPRLRTTGGTHRAELVEFDPRLREIAATPLEDYPGGESPAGHHGIVAFTWLGDDSTVFTTHAGRLYRIRPTPGAAAKVEDAGFMHPDGAAYAPALFPFSGESLVAGVARRGHGEFEWVVHDLDTGLAGAFPFDTSFLPKLLLYGSVTRDDEGRFYLGGWSDGRPVLLQVDARGTQAPAVGP